MIKNTIEFHAISNIFPMMSPAEFAELKEDVRKNGQLEPIWIHDNKIIDGRNRYKACQELGIEPKYKTWQGEGSLINFVVSLNLKRRHLTSSQKAMIAIDILPMLEAEAKERQLSTLKQNATVPQLFEERNEGEASDHAAKLTGTNRQYVYDAKRIKEQAPELVEDIRSGEITIQEAKHKIKKTTTNHDVLVTKFTGDDEWYTPIHYIDKARLVMGSIDIDPASNSFAQSRIKAAKYYTIDNSSIDKDWVGNVWMNPPYSKGNIDKFIDKLIEEVDKGNTKQFLVLTNNGTDTQWFKKIAVNCSLICFTTGRISFEKEDEIKSSPVNGQVFFYFGGNTELFLQLFSDVGIIMEVK